MKSTEKHQRRRLITAPPPSHHPGLQSTVLNVECSNDEEVEWLWTATPGGRFVSGYQFVPRLKLPT